MYTHYTSHERQPVGTLKIGQYCKFYDDVRDYPLGKIVYRNEQQTVIERETGSLAIRNNRVMVSRVDIECHDVEEHYTLIRDLKRTDKFALTPNGTLVYQITGRNKDTYTAKDQFERVESFPDDFAVYKVIILDIGGPF